MTEYAYVHEKIEQEGYAVIKIPNIELSSDQLNFISSKIMHNNDTVHTFQDLIKGFENIIFTLFICLAIVYCVSFIIFLFYFPYIVTIKNYKTKGVSISGDNTRLMLYMDKPISFLSPIVNQVKQLMQILFPLLQGRDESLICSLPSTMKQTIHCDYDLTVEAKELFFDTKQPPLGVLVALEPNTKLMVFPKSHTIVWTLLETKSSRIPSLNLKPIDGMTIDIPQYSAVIFRQDLVHAGECYSIRNLRIHIYLDRILPGRKHFRKRDTTFPISKMGPSAVKLFILPTSTFSDSDNNNNNSDNNNNNNKKRGVNDSLNEQDFKKMKLI